MKKNLSKYLKPILAGAFALSVAFTPVKGNYTDVLAQKPSHHIQYKSEKHQKDEKLEDLLEREEPIRTRNDLRQYLDYSYDLEDQERWDDSIKLNKHALELVEGLSESMLWYVYTNIGGAYFNKEDYEESLTWMKKAESAVLEYRGSHTQAMVDHNLAMIYYMLKDYKMALVNIDAALKTYYGIFVNRTPSAWELKTRILKDYANITEDNKKKEDMQLKAYESILKAIEDYQFYLDGYYFDEEKQQYEKQPPKLYTEGIENSKKLEKELKEILGEEKINDFLESKKPLEEKIEEFSNIRTIKGNTYVIDGQILTQTTEDEDKKAVFGVISDVEGYYENAEAFANYFKSINVDGIIMLGDYAENNPNKKPNMMLSEYDEIRLSVEAAAKTGLPVYVIPGNEEMKETYWKVMGELLQKYPNLFDMAQIRTVDGDDFDLVSNPYGRGYGYLMEGFLGAEHQIRDVVKYAEMLKNDDDPEILITHKPPKCVGEYGVDIPFHNFPGEDRNVGDATLNEVMKQAEIKFSLSGHIHESGGRGVTSYGEEVEAGELSDDLRLNPGAAHPTGYLNEEHHEALFIGRENQILERTFTKKEIAEKLADYIIMNCEL